jgi:phage tail tape-measure protein
MDRNERHTRDANRDPLTGEPGAHPVGTGIGAAAGGTAAGAAAGVAGGSAGAVVGGIVGGLAGKAAGEAIDPTREDAYWKNNYKREAYYDSSLSYDDYSPAYRTGYGTCALR